jgi:hypothetical protein
MRNSNLLLVVFCVFLFVSCSSSGEEKTEESNLRTEAVDTLGEPTALPPGVALNSMIRAKYISAVVYAAATDYVFELDDGQKITIRVSQEEGAVNPEIPSILLEAGDGLEGPPGANPALVGKYLTIEQDQSGNTLRVIYSQGKKVEAVE